jgi:transcriptional regulator GlxA family with amidase domain
MLPQRLRRARDFLAAHAEDPLDLALLADAAGISIRALQLGFQRHFGMSISKMLLDLRLAQPNSRLEGWAATCAYHRYCLRSQIYPCEQDGRRLPAKVRRNAVGDAAAAALRRLQRAVPLHHELTWIKSRSSG